MTQLGLFAWAKKEGLLHDLGGRCPYCLEYENWLTIDRFLNDEHREELTIQCQTVRVHENGDYDDLCKNTIEIVEGMKR